MPRAIAQYVLKVHSRCDLACDHCYVYEHADQSWRRQPREIEHETVVRAADRIAQHSALHRLPSTRVVLHGGEPLLLGPARLDRIADTLRKRIGPLTSLDLSIQTNGVRLDERFGEVFVRHRVRVGISLDGDQAANDRHRKFADGRSSYAQVRSALRLLRRPEYRHIYAGILCTIDLANDPIAVYEALLAEEPSQVDLLLPHATWEHPPLRSGESPTPYADWLGRVFARWNADRRPFDIRLFNSLQSVARGGPSWSESVGLDPANFVVIDTDGSWQQADSLKTAYDGAPAIGFSVFTHSVDEVAAHPSIAAHDGGAAALCRQCQMCSVVHICGGGLYAHRYRADTGFDNPSVYCADLKALIEQVAVPGTEQVMARGTESVDHRLPPGSFSIFAAGPGDVPGMMVLAGMRLSLVRALVAGVAAGSAGADGELAEVAAAGWEFLARLDVRYPQAVADVLSHPYTQVWATRCLRPPQGSDLDLDRAHLAGLAAAAAWRACQPAEVRLPVRDGLGYLPGVGALRADLADGRVMTIMISDSGKVATLEGETQWLPARRLAGPELSVVVEDLDPFRDCHGWPTTGRLTDSDWVRWRQALIAAAAELDRLLPEYTSVLRAGLHAVVPLKADGTGQALSATSRHAFAGVGAALTDDLAALLVHEFQHAKLNALLALYRMFDPTEGCLIRVPWRPDPRPVEAVLHGVYAHLAVAALWRARMRSAEAGEPANARSYFGQYHNWIDRSADALADTGALTAAGHHFVAGMRETIDQWAHER